jgi:hypothetical protein
MDVSRVCINSLRLRKHTSVVANISPLVSMSLLGRVGVGKGSAFAVEYPNCQTAGIPFLVSSQGQLEDAVTAINSASTPMYVHITGDLDLNLPSTIISKVDVCIEVRGYDERGRAMLSISMSCFLSCQVRVSSVRPFHSFMWVHSLLRRQLVRVSS